MIDAREILKSIKLSAPDEAEVRRLGEEIAVAVKNYDGRPFNIQIPVGEGEEQHARTYRIACALQRRFQANWWFVHLETVQDAFGQPSAHSLWFTIDPAAGREAVKDALHAPVEAKFTLRGLHEELSGMFGGEDVPVFAKDPVLSVIFATCNRLPHLKRAIASIRRSVGDLTYEIVVTDGGSFDGSRQWLAAQPDVLLVGDRHLRGAVDAFNRAFTMCRGEFVANANDDIVYEGLALYKGVEHLRAHGDVGQVAFGLRGEGEKCLVNEVHPGMPYANHGIVRKSLADKIAYIQGGYWAPCYATYAADCEFSAWCHRLSKVEALPHLHVFDSRPDDELRERNKARFGADTKRMYARWPVASLRPDGPPPRVSAVETARYLEVVRESGTRTIEIHGGEKDALETFVELVGFPEPQEERRLRKLAPLLRVLDPVEGRLPVRAEKIGFERVLHVHINGKDAIDQQEGLVRALKEFGPYEMVRWTDYGHMERQERILEAARAHMPSLVFMQLQTPDVVDLETIRMLRRIVPEAVIATWSGDIADCNSPWNVDWQVPIGRLVDLTLHSSFTHVRVLRAAGVHNAARLDIAIDPERYRPLSEGMLRSDAAIVDVAPYVHDVLFLGNRYAESDPFSASYRWRSGVPAHDGALRDEIVRKMKEVFGPRFGLFGAGWGGDVRSVPVTESPEIYWRSKIGLSVSLDSKLECYSSDRLHRILGCGALLLVKSFPGMEVLGLEDGTNCFCFDTVEEAVYKAKFALDTPIPNEDGVLPRYGLARCDREAIAAAGAELARDRHTWSVRMRELQLHIDAVRAARKESP